jgi:hypothetical protein
VGGSAVSFLGRGAARQQKDAAMTDLTRDEREALVLLSLTYPAAVAYVEDRGEAIEVFEELVERKRAIRIRSDDFEGVAYQLSPEMAEAHRRVIANRADRAGLN